MLWNLSIGSNQHSIWDYCTMITMTAIFNFARASFQMNFTLKWVLLFVSFSTVADWFLTVFTVWIRCCFLLIRLWSIFLVCAALNFAYLVCERPLNWNSRYLFNEFTLVATADPVRVPSIYERLVGREMSFIFLDDGGRLMRWFERWVKSVEIRPGLKCGIAKFSKDDFDGAAFGFQWERFGANLPRRIKRTSESVPTSESMCDFAEQWSQVKRTFFDGATKSKHHFSNQKNRKKFLRKIP